MGAEVDELRIAVIGCGSIGRRHIQNLLAMGEREIGVYDANMDASSSVCTAERGDAVGLFGDMEDLWNWHPDAVLICTPPETHLDLLYEAWRKCGAVFVEKPLDTSDVLRADILAHLLAKENTITMVAAQWRWHLGVMALKRWLDEGAIGDVLSARFSVGYYLPDTKPNYKETYAATTGATLDVAWHMADLALWMLGSAKLRSAAVRSAKCIGLEGVDGLASLLLDHDNGAISVVEGNFVQRSYSVGIELVGSKNSANWEYNRQTAVLNMANREGVSTGTMEDINECYLRELSHFLACVRENKPTCNPVSNAVNVLRILLETKQCGR